MPHVADQHAGKWLTSKQIKSLIEKVNTYVAKKQEPSSSTAKQGNDTAFGRFNPSTTSNGRRFPLLSNTVSKDRVNQWLKIIERQYCINIHQNDTHIPF